MKLYINLKSALSVLSLLFFYSLNASAQFPGMAAVRAQQNQQFMNQQMQTQMQMLMNMNWRQNAGKGDTYMITFKDSSVKKVVSWMYTDTILHKNFLVLVDKKFSKSDSVHRTQKIYSDQTQYISTIADYQSNREIYGIPTDSCWMFKVMSGPINVYSKYFNEFENDFHNAVIAIQLNDGPIVKYSVDALKQMVGQNADALAYIEKENYYKAIKKYNHDVEKSQKK